MKTAAILALAAGAAVAGCSGGAARPATAACAPSTSWQSVATDDDHSRLRAYSATWTTALADVRSGGSGAAVDGDAALFSAAETLDQPVPPPGDYRCRSFKLGSNGPAVAAFTAYPAQPCRIAQTGDVSNFTVLDGPQRPIGSIYSDEAKRGVFLGTLQLGDETVPSAYGRDELRDLGGFVARMGARRWRLVLPQPHFESRLDVIEIVPAG